MKLTEKQQEAIDIALSLKKPLTRIAGYAGTGKSTIAKIIYDDFVSNGIKPLACTFMGKSSQVLRNKGIQANTVHSTIYSYDEDADEYCLKTPDELQGDLFFIDEAQTLNQELWSDILTFERPVLCFGDPGQIEPIGANPQLMKNSDILLDEVVRSDDHIIRQATHVRETGEYIEGSWVEEFPKNYVPWNNNIVICGYNKTRCNINKWYYDKERKKENVPYIVQHNNRKFGVYNGEIVYVRDNKIVKEDGRVLSQAVPCFRQLFQERFERPDKNYKVVLDAAYALTCHKALGSEFEEVVIVDQPFCENWRYTALTRAIKKYTIVKEN